MPNLLLVYNNYLSFEVTAQRAEFLSLLVIPGCDTRSGPVRSAQLLWAWLLA
jgi:hypothetical protein